MTVAIIDYGSGNLRSAAKAFERVAGAERIVVTAKAEEVAAADRIVLPGVGAFADCLAGIEALPGMRDALEEAVRLSGRPFFGICVGMQLMASRGLEHGSHEGFGWMAGEVAHLEPADAALKVPHMGWNALAMERPHPVLAGIEDGAHCYFVHSYAFAVADGGDRLAAVDHGGAVTAAVARDNMVGTQFHPEKSQRVGLAVIANFLAWRP
jgi:glutamine amidotransferase